MRAAIHERPLRQKHAAIEHDQESSPAPGSILQNKFSQQSAGNECHENVDQLQIAHGLQRSEPLERSGCENHHGDRLLKTPNAKTASAKRARRFSPRRSATRQSIANRTSGASAPSHSYHVHRRGSNNCASQALRASPQLAVRKPIPEAPRLRPILERPQPKGNRLKQRKREETTKRDAQSGHDGMEQKCGHQEQYGLPAFAVEDAPDWREE